QEEDGIRDRNVTGVQTCALPISAILGVLYKTLSPRVSPKISLAFYLVMGWMILPLLPTLLFDTNIMFIIMLALGGVLYKIDTWFYAQKDRKYFHMICHFFIIAVSIAHYVGIVFYMI